MRTVAIVGSQSKTRSLAPFDDPDIDIWVFNEAANQEWCKRADAVFQMHVPAIYRNPHNPSDADHWEWLKRNRSVLVYMQDADPAVPQSATYPLDVVCSYLLAGFRQGVGHNLRRYFTSTIAYALALAIYQGYEKIEIYGVEMGSNTEYQYQQPCALFWVGLALGRGIQVDFISGDDIFSAPLYGYEGIIEADLGEFARRSGELRQEIAGIMDRKAHIEKTLHYGGQSLNGDLAPMLAQLIDIFGALGKAEGALAENERYLFAASEMVKDGGPAYIDRSEYESENALHRAMADDAMKGLYRISGSLDYVVGVWNATDNPKAFEQIMRFTETACNRAYASGRSIGIGEENARYMAILDARIRAAGGAKAQKMMEGQA